jgi:hypothetical protein
MLVPVDVIHLIAIPFKKKESKTMNDTAAGENTTHKAVAQYLLQEH